MYHLELEKLKSQIEEIENKIEDNDEYLFEDEFESFYESVVEQYDQLFEDLNSYFRKEVINEKTEESIHKQLKDLKKLKQRITDIETQAGKESDEDIRDFMFPNKDDE